MNKSPFFRTSLFILVLLLLAAVAVSAQTGKAMPPSAGGIHWQPLCEPGSGGWLTGLAISPHDLKRVLLSGDMLGVGLSEDGGKSWQATFGFKSWEMADFTWHPRNPNVVWVGSMSGPYVSMDGGRHWEERRIGFPPLAQGYGYSAPIEKVLFDPNKDTHLFAVGGSSRGWDAGGKPTWGAVWESMDGGQSWQRLTTITAEGSSVAPDAKGVNVNSATFAPGSSTTLYAAARGVGVLVSVDGGKTWSVRNQGLPHPVVERVVAHPKDKDTLWCALGTYKPQGADLCIPGGIYKSVDGGRQWTPLNTGLNQKAAKEDVFTSSYKAFAVSPSHPDVMYANDQAWNTGVTFGSVNGGKSWRPLVTKQNIGNDDKDPTRQKVVQIETAFPAGAAQTVFTVAPHNPNVAMSAGGEYVLETEDGGKTWLDGTAFHPDNSTAWRGRGYSGLCSWNFRFNPYNPKQAILQAMDAARIWESNDNLHSWTRFLNDPMPWFGGHDVTFTPDGHIYSTSGQSGFFGIGRSLDGGKTWTVLAGAKRNLPEFQQQNANPDGIYARPDKPEQVWACIGGKLCHSADAGETWKTIHKGPGMTWIVGDPKNPARFYVSGDKNIYRADDGGMTLIPIGGPHKAGRLTMDSLGRLYVTANQGQRPGLWRCDHPEQVKVGPPIRDVASEAGKAYSLITDGGGWKRLWDNTWAEGVAVDPSNPNRLAITTNQNPYVDVSGATGVWISADAGETWTQANDGLAMLRGLTIAFNPHDPTQLVFGSFGRGFFQARWPKTFTPTNGKGSVRTADDARFAMPDFSLPPPPKTPVLQNGSMAQGADKPTGWDLNWTGKGKLVVRRDTNVVKNGPASLMIASQGGEALGQAAQLLDGEGGTKLTLSGWVKSTGTVKVNVAIQAFTGGYAPISFQQAQYVQNDADWTHFSKEITLPEGAAHFGVVLLLEGDGKAWLSDVKLTDVKFSAD